MQGLMMDQPLLISGLIRHADRHHGATQIVSKTVEGAVHRYTYRDAHRRWFERYQDCAGGACASVTSRQRSGVDSPQ